MKMDNRIDNTNLNMNEYQVKIDFPIWLAGRMWLPGIYIRPQSILVKCAMQYIGDDNSIIYFIKDGERVDPEVQEKVLYKRAFAYAKVSKGSLQFRNIFGEVVASIKGVNGGKANGFNILGAYSSYEELCAYHPIASGEGDAYLVSGDVYIWTIDVLEGSGKWKNGGSLIINVNGELNAGTIGLTKTTKKKVEVPDLSTQLYINMLELAKSTNADICNLKNMWFDNIDGSDISAEYLNRSLSSGYRYDAVSKSYKPNSNIRFISSDTLAYFPFDTDLKNIVDSKVLEKHGEGVFIESNTFKFGKGSCYFSGDTVSYLHEKNNKFNFGKNDFTIHTWIYPEYQKSNYPVIFSNSENTIGLTVKDVIAGENISFYIGEEVPRAIDSDTYYEVNDWTHIALTRKKGIFYLFVNGSLKGTNDKYKSLDVDLTNMDIGLTSGSPNETSYIGYIDDFVIVNKALWTNNFDVPQIPWASSDLEEVPVSTLYWNKIIPEGVVNRILVSSDYEGDVVYSASCDDGKTFNVLTLNEFNELESEEEINGIILKAELSGEESNIYNIGVVMER